jgi:chemotaxis protein CheD
MIAGSKPGRFFLEEQSVVIGIGDFRVGSFPMATVGLGSCVALILHDQRKCIGGMAHVMLPESRGDPARPAKFADTALEILVAELENMGSIRPYLTAKLVGGACMFEYSSANLNIGERNVEAIKALLNSCRIRIDAEETGGKVGRSIIYRPAEKGRVTVKRADGTCTDI